MENKERYQKETKIDKQLCFCRELLARLTDDFYDSVEKQKKDPWDNLRFIRNRSRFAQDVVRLRRELMVLENLFNK